MIVKKPILFSFLVLLTLVSCSTKKDKFLNRTYNAITTKYNILYNGNIAFQEGLHQISQKHKDNFWEQLSIEPITFDPVKPTLPTLGGNFNQKNNEVKQLTTFDKAEEKAVKAIQLHSMNIGGRERNHQIDDAYLLLGKSRYYTQRFVPAIEAFNYIIVNYPYAELINETRIWRAKTNIRLNNDQLAIESLNIVLKTKELEPKIKEEAHTALAMAYVKKDSVEAAIKHLTLATETQENIEQASRNLFVLGQLYAKVSKRDSAALAFNKLINLKKAPYKYKIYANIDLAKVASNDSVVNSLLEKFDDLTKARENRKYLDALYYQVGILEEKRDSLHLALKYFKKSLRVPNGDRIQKTYGYEKLGNIAFDHKLYVQASTYYDSVIQISKGSSDRRIRMIRRKHKNLAALTNFENVLRDNDSILRIADLSKKEQIEYFNDYIKALKKADERKAKEQLKSITFGSSFRGGSSIRTNNKKGKWYFYNNQSLNFGKTEFERIWGNRPLVDNWRISEKQQVSTTVSSQTKKKEDQAKLPKYDLRTYLSALPKNKSEIDSLAYHRNEALYQTGIIYKEQFKNLDLSILRLERLLKSKPDKSLILPTTYLLHQVYKEIGSKNADKYKNQIIENYPKTKYAEILLNKPKKEDEETITITESIYKELYYLYKEDRFDEVVSQIIELGPLIKDSNLIAKFELLKALSIGKYQSKTAYKKALDYVASNFGNTQQGQEAKEIIKKLN